MWNLSIALSVQPNELCHHRSHPTPAVQSQHGEERSAEVELADVELPAVQSRTFNFTVVSGGEGRGRRAEGGQQQLHRILFLSLARRRFQRSGRSGDGGSSRRYLNRLVSGINIIGETNTER